MNNKNTGDGELDEIINAVQLGVIAQNSLERIRAEAKTAIKKYASQEANKAQQQLLQELMEELPDREKLVDDLRYSNEFRQWYEGFNKCRTQVKSAIQNKLEGLS